MEIKVCLLNSSGNVAKHFPKEFQIFSGFFFFWLRNREYVTKYSPFIFIFHICAIFCPGKKKAWFKEPFRRILKIDLENWSFIKFPSNSMEFRSEGILGTFHGDKFQLCTQYVIILLLCWEI